MSIANLPLCIAARGSTPTAPPPPSPLFINQALHSGSVPLDQIFNYSERLAREFERRLKEAVRTFLLLKVPEDTGNLVYNYIFNFWMRDIFTQGLELVSQIDYAPFVEEAVGRDWQKVTAVDHAIEITRQHILEIYPAILEMAARATGMSVEVQHFGL